MHRLSITLIIICSVFTFCLYSCNKKQDTPQQPAPIFTVDNKWECRIDGVLYSGTIDTSFVEIRSSGFSDTIVQCTGTATDKKANIYFRLNINRRSSSNAANSNIGRSLFLFDTLTSQPLVGAQSIYGTNILFVADSLAENKLKGSFSGTAMPPQTGATPHTVTNGKFSCEFGRGTAEPKFFSFTGNAENITGYWSSAQVVSNTLILEGIPYDFFGSNRFKLLIRTGGTIQTGTYTSAAGNVGLQYYIPSIQRFYVNDTLGNLSVTIQSLNGNIITGSYSGTSRMGESLANGKFTCRVKNYLPQTDFANKWSFGTDDGTFLYNLYGGNVLNAQRSQTGNVSRVTVNGESDNGTSKFKLILSSGSAITTGVYQAGFSSTNRIDSMYFIPNPALAGFYTPVSFTTSSSGFNTYCVVDSIDAQKIVGRLYGYTAIPSNPNVFLLSELRKGRFRANF